MSFTTPTVQLTTKRLRKLISNGDTTPQDKEITEKIISESKDGEQVVVDLVRIPTALLEKMLHDTTLSETKRDQIGTFLALSSTVEKLFSQTVNTVKEIHNTMKGLERGKSKEPNAEFFLLGRWYPIRLQSRFFSGMFGSYCQVTGQYEFADVVRTASWGFADSDFIDRDNNRIPRKIVDLLKDEGLRPLQIDMRDFSNLVLEAGKVSKQVGSVRSARGPALLYEKFAWWKKIEEINFGSGELPKKVVVEPELEIDESKHNHYSWYDDNNSLITLPLVRVFSLDKKKYLYMDVRDIPEHNFDTEALDRLVLPPSVQKILKKVFTSDVNHLFGDLMKDKSGGMIILANGGTGVGKTLTAEIFAEHTRRPLYVLEVAELGVTPGEVEQNLARILKRAERWNAELLFDECDLFLAKRDEQQLMRSAIVCVFLRLLDYNRGLMFMTTNRGEVLDPALKSRITLYLNYPSLDEAARARIWDAMLKASNLTLEGDIQKIAALELNGRQIRNQVRLLKVIYEDKVTAEQIVEMSEYAAHD